MYYHGKTNAARHWCFQASTQAFATHRTHQEENNFRQLMLNQIMTILEIIS